MTTGTTPLGEIMARHNLSDALVSSAIAVTRTAVLYWRQGKGEPGGRKLLKLTAYLRTYEPGLTPEQLLPEVPK